MCKPAGGGLWTSTLTKGGSDWVRWNRQENGGRYEWSGYVLYPLRSARTYRINSVRDYERLIDEYGYIYPFNPNGSRNTRWMVIDFERLATKCDGLHLTEIGQRETRFHMSPERNGFLPPSLYGWDCESTVWFRWAFSNKIRLAHGHV